MEGKYQRIYELARPYLETRQNDIHTRVAYSFACKLLGAEGGDEHVVLPAVILHDVGWDAVPEDLQLKAFGPGHNDLKIQRIHEIEGAKVARHILQEVDYDPHCIEEIVAIVLQHDSGTLAQSLNDAIVKDSDKLWRFSAEALTIDPERFGIDPKIHAKWLKTKIEKWFFTETAKKIALEELHQRYISLGISSLQEDQ